jgi:hypothetical protein
MFVLLFGLAAALICGSGAARVSSAKERFSQAATEYHRLIAQSEQLNGKLRVTLTAIGDQIIKSLKSLKAANKILDPAGRGLALPSLRNSAGMNKAALSVLGTGSLISRDYNAAPSAVIGLGVGSALAVGSWTAVSMLGAASTGTAIVGLHGIAYTNAVLASLGGGTLAAGAAGVVGGKLALVSMVLVPVVAVMGFASHVEASEINERAGKIEDANYRNSTTLWKIEEQEPRINAVLPRVIRENDGLAGAVVKARSELFRYGFFSKIYKVIRFHLKGNYYTKEEMVHVEKLASAVDRFVAAVRGDRDQTSRNKPIAMLSR